MTEKELYPKWVESVQKVKQINADANNQIWVSLLRSDRRPVLDVRMWINGLPTRCGVYLTFKSADELIYLLDKYLTGEDLTDPDV